MKMGWWKQHISIRVRSPAKQTDVDVKVGRTAKPSKTVKRTRGKQPLSEKIRAVFTRSKKATTTKPKDRKAAGSHDHKEKERLRQQAELNRSRDLHDKHMLPEYHEDMTAYLEDNRHDEVARSSWWKRSKKHAAEAYSDAMMEEQRMAAMDEAYRTEAHSMYARKAGKKRGKK